MRSSVRLMMRLRMIIVMVMIELWVMVVCFFGLSIIVEIRMILISMMESVRIREL